MEQEELGPAQTACIGWIITSHPAGNGGEWCHLHINTQRNAITLVWLKQFSGPWNPIGVYEREGMRDVMKKKRRRGWGCFCSHDAALLFRGHTRTACLKAFFLSSTSSSHPISSPHHCCSDFYLFTPTNSSSISPLIIYSMCTISILIYLTYASSLLPFLPCRCFEYFS